MPYRQLPRDQQEELLLTQRMQFNPAHAEGETPHATYYGRLLGLVNNIEARLNDRRYDFLLRPFEQAQRKVTAMDVARFVEDLFRPAQDKIEDRVDALLHEEIINLSSMGYIRDAQPGEGRQPLTDADLSEPVRKAGRIPATALWDAMSASRAQVSEMLDEVGSAIASQGSVAVSGGPSRRTLVAWGIGFLVLLLALAYVVVRYVYAL